MSNDIDDVIDEVMSKAEGESPTDDFIPHVPGISDQPLPTAHAIAGLALTLAMKFHDINTIQDGALYQQYKLEGRNMRNLDLDMVFHSAERIEAWLLGSSNRIAGMVIAAIEAGDEEDKEEGEEEVEEAPTPTPGGETQ